MLVCLEKRAKAMDRFIMESAKFLLLLERELKFCILFAIGGDRKLFVMSATGSRSADATEKPPPEEGLAPTLAGVLWVERGLLISIVSAALGFVDEGEEKGFEAALDVAGPLLDRRKLLCNVVGTV